MAQPGGETAAKKRPGGRPVIWTPAVLAALSDKFLTYIDTHEIPIVAEFAYLNDTHREELYKHPELNYALRKCISKKEAALESKALAGDVNVTMAIFSLKQIGWSDKQEVDTTHHIRFEADLDGPPED